MRPSTRTLHTDLHPRVICPGLGAPTPPHLVTASRSATALATESGPKATDDPVETSIQCMLSSDSWSDPWSWTSCLCLLLSWLDPTSRGLFCPLSHSSTSSITPCPSCSTAPQPGTISSIPTRRTECASLDDPTRYVSGGLLYLLVHCMVISARVSLVTPRKAMPPS